MHENKLAKILYAALFCGVLPGLLVAWSKATAHLVTWPAVQSLLLGGPLVVVGGALMFLGMRALWTWGGGLPMNIAPPPRYVTRGVYGYLAHPIYVGFCLACVGVALATGSASGLWLVSPCVILATTALVLGYEAPELRQRFGAVVTAPRLQLPGAEDPAPTPGQRAAAYLYVIAPWLALYEAILALGPASDARSAYLPFELSWPVWPWTEIIYASTYLAVLAAPLLAPSRRALRAFMLHALLAMALVFPIYLCVPLVSEPRVFHQTGGLADVLALERRFDGASGSFPAFHVIWAVLAARVLRARWPGFARAWAGYGFAVAISCITTGMHALLDVLAAFATIALLDRAGALWRTVRRSAERIANSWHEWSYGQVRIINHGAYAAAGTFVALAVVITLTGGAVQATVAASTCGLIGAALWAQIVEGSPRLLRPYGFYGGMLGVSLGALAAPLFGSSTWLVLAAYCTAAPYVQSLGRLRCLVQGCCHGSPAPENIGICYVHPRSRVCRLSDYRDVPLHPTPVYSIAWNIAIALCTARMFWLHAPLHLVGAMYLMLSGAGRFVEEAYRGEPQTPVFARLRLYQWIALGTLLLGAVLSAVGVSANASTPMFQPDALPVAAAFSVVVFCALGVDFPHSNTRFARLV